ncbi:MAG TPA: tyrosine-protein phosphatase [Catenuloplanes sp.]|jgi:protein tyrosine/serine phosphatase
MTRNLSFSTTFNFRDIGGYAGMDGRSVRWRRLFRSDSLHRLGEADREAFTALGVRTVVDLRRPREVTRDGRVHESHNLDYRHIHPEHQDWDEIHYDERHGVARFLADRYLDLAEQGSAGLAAALAVVADPIAAPVVVHCVAGKDRTGVVCALTLSLLGVSDEDIVEDYALSTAASQRFGAWVRQQYPDLPPMHQPYYDSPAEAMALFLAELRRRHGTVEGYATGAGVTPAQIAALRQHLLE